MRKKLSCIRNQVRVAFMDWVKRKENNFFQVVAVCGCSLRRTPDPFGFGADLRVSFPMA